MVIIVRPGPATPPPTDPFLVAWDVETQPLSWRWTSWTGESWELTNRTSPVIKLRGALGLGPVDPEHWYSEAPTMDGSSWDGYRVGKGQLFVPVRVKGTDSQDFIEKNASFLRSLAAGKEGVMRITRPNGEWREARCRYASGADQAMNLDPVKQCEATYPITWDRANPYWSGPRVKMVFGSGADVPFFPGPPFHINPGRTIAAARFTNPGTEGASALWRIHGPFTGFSVGVGEGDEAAVVSLELTKLAGQWVQIDMAPDKRTIVDASGNDWWLAATTADFADIPPGDDLPLTIVVPGSGDETSVELSFEPQYSSALV